MIYIIIPVFNRQEFTRKCLISLEKQKYQRFQIIVVDDGSTDGTREMLLNEFEKIIRIEGSGDLWWAGATNAGVKYVIENLKPEKSDYILTLNNDLEVNANYLDSLVIASQNNAPCLVGSICLDFDFKNRVDDMGCKWNKYTAKYSHLKNTYGEDYDLLISKTKRYFECDMLSGRGVLIPIEVFDTIGYFDNVSFPQYAADNDFSIRTKNQGYRLIISSDSPVYAHLKETGDDFNRNISYKVFINSFFSIRSSTNLKTRYLFALKHSPIKVVYFCIDIVRIVFSFHILLFKKSFSIWKRLF